MNLTDFIAKYTGVSGVGDTPENISQCVGLIEVYLDNLGLNNPHLYSNAKDLLANADINKFNVIANAPDNFPLPGDVVCFDGTYGNGFGHTGIVVTADVNSMSLFEANDPTGSTPHLKTYTYDNCLGWLHPKIPFVSPDVALQQELDKCRVDRDQHWNDLQTTKATIDSQAQLINKVNAENNSLQTQLKASQDQVATLQPLADSVLDLKKQLSQCISDRGACLISEANNEITITNLKQQIIQGKPVGLWNRLKYLFS